MPSPTLIDYYLPHYDFQEIHSIIIEHSCEKVFPLVKSLDLSSEEIIKMLFKLRGLPVTEFTLLGLVKQINFTWLGERENKELLIGCWGNSKPEYIPNPEAFLTNTTTYPRKITWNFLLEPLNETTCKVSTETRVKHYTGKAKRIFQIYWFFIRPFSGLIRMLLLRKLKRTLAG